MKLTRIVLAALSLMFLNACSANILDKGATDETKAQTHSLEREYQRTRRYDCYGRLSSDSYELVGDSKELVQINPRISGSYSSAFRNETTGSSPACVAEGTKFNINMADTTCDMRVQQGLNRISYAFSYCDRYTTLTDREGRSYKTCAHEPYVREQGQLFIRVSFSERRNEEIRNVHPYPEECHRTEFN